MRDRNNPLKHIPPQAFTIIQSFREEFIRDLADIPTRYQGGIIPVISQQMTVPVLMVREEFQDRIVYLQAVTLEDLIREIETSPAPIVFIQYTPAWYENCEPEKIDSFIALCRERARKKGSVVILAVFSVDIIQPLKNGTDHFTQVYPVRTREKLLALKEQTRLDSIDISLPGPVTVSKMCGQMKLGIN